MIAVPDDRRELEQEVPQLARDFGANVARVARTHPKLAKAYVEYIEALAAALVAEVAQ